MSDAAEARILRAITSGRKPRVLYHYTSGAGLIGIVETEAIWATNIRFLNDSTEFSFALNLAQQLVEERQNSATNQFDNALYTVLRERLSGTQDFDVYVSSFTESGDQLSQWRAYCPASGGYALGFSSKGLLSARPPLQGAALVRCVYDRDDQQEIISKVFKSVTDFAEEKRHAGLSHDRVFRESFKQLGRLLALVAPALKHPSFAEEREWRLVVPEGSFAQDEDTLHFREGRSTLVPFHAYSFAYMPLERLMIGPTPHPDLARDVVQSLLAAKGLSATTIRVSSIPNRTW